ncbi:MAG: tRNA (5-methylaminomethyl-2-thiouridine)(34)-methyltransferase MnmD [Bacteroidetes bacterium]|nr:tRNA (5-methylaminomethyl-2-thiouridine)(34)-methyltransferase MnmD [Bacteroidota bacterium]
MQEGISLVMSEDGSHTLFHKGLQEHYHSIHGAIQESKHIFIEAGFRFAESSNNHINVLEIGFGTGLNAMLTCLAAMETSLQVYYHGIEAFPLKAPVWSSLNYDIRLNSSMAKSVFGEIHGSEWNIINKLLPGFTLLKTASRLQEVQLQTSYYNLVYFDAFSPEVQPEMWTGEIFARISDSLVTGGILVTYCCKGIVKRALKSAGFLIEKLPGPPGKREILRAVKK